MKLAVVIAAAGRSRRCGFDKLAASLGGATVLERSVGALRAALPTSPTVVVVDDDRVDHWRYCLSSCEVIAGGPRRQDSVRLGVEKAAELDAEIVAIHDGARPLVHPEDVTRVIESLGGGDAVILCARVTDTIKRVAASELVEETVERDRLRLAQTPQVFRIAALEAAWGRQDPTSVWTDEAALLEIAGGKVLTVISNHANPKLTTAEDLKLMRLMIGDKQ